MWPRGYALSPSAHLTLTPTRTTPPPTPKPHTTQVRDQLHKDGVKCADIHGDRSQGQRESALARFREGAIDVLVATDVASRGIDVPCAGSLPNPTFKLVKFLDVLLICLDFHDFWSKFGHIYSFLQGIRI